MSRIAAIRHHWIAAALAVVCTVGLIGSSGCILAVQSDSHYKRGHDAMQSLAMIRAGTTSRAWVVEHMGTPDSSYVNADDNEVLRYLSVREQETGVALLWLFSVDVSEEELRTLHVEIEDDVVKGYWIE